MTLSVPAQRLVLIVLLLASSISVLSQKQSSYWIFGYQSGLDFRSGQPVPVYNPNINTNEGVATVNDADGNLLFYSNGETVFNAMHDTMMNGTSLHGDWSSSQSIVVVRAIADSSLYFLFTVAKEAEANGMSYSVVDMKKDNGRGAVTVKNVRLFTRSTEQLCMVLHCNRRDVWVISHEWNTDAYYAFLVTPAGVSTTPVVSYTGRKAAPGALNAIGCMKASPDGRKIAATFNLSGADLSDFDNATGIVSNSIDLQVFDNYYAHTYGVEFSPNSRLLYLTYSVISDILYQYDVAAATPAAIVASKMKIAEINTLWQTFGTIQTGPDGKLYMANYWGKYLSVINKPNVRGTGCGFKWEAIEMVGSSTFGLPAFVESVYEPLFQANGACNGQSIHFEYEKPDFVLSVMWDFDDPASGAANFSTLSNPVHQYATEGIYSVKLIRFTNCGSDTMVKQVFAGEFNFSLGNDTTVCTGAGHELQVKDAAMFNYLWQDGSSGNTMIAGQSGTYWVETTDQQTGCKARDSINLTLQRTPQFTLGEDIVSCNEEVVLNVAAAGSAYLWNTGNTTPQEVVSIPGTYWLQVENGMCVFRDTVSIAFRSPPKVNLGRDTTLCEGATLILKGEDGTASYKWSDGSVSNELEVRQEGTYAVVASNGVCLATDSIQVRFESKPSFSLGADKQICGGDQIMLTIDAAEEYAYTWADGSTHSTYMVNKPGVYSVEATNMCGTSTDEIIVEAGGCMLAVPNAFTPNGDGNNDVFVVSKTKLLQSFSMQLFNRWGQKVFQSHDQTKGWDGTFAGRKADPGNYVYVIQFANANGQPISMKGVILLVR